MYQRILVPVDGSGTSRRGLQEAIRLGKLTGARLKLVHLAEQVPYETVLAADMIPILREAGEKVLRDSRTQVEAAGLPVEIRLMESNSQRLAEVVRAEAHAWAADLIVLGTHGRRGLNRMFLGSDAEQVVRLSEVPVLLVRGKDDDTAL